MEINYSIKTGNRIVDQIAKINFSGNVMFLELYPDALLSLTYPKHDSESSNDTGISENENTSLQICQEEFTKKETYPSQKGNTNTENTTETTTELAGLEKLSGVAINQSTLQIKRQILPETASTISNSSTMIGMR